MSEAYYLAGALNASPREAVQAALAAARAQPAWIEEVFILAGRPAPALPDLPANVPLSCWTNQPGLDAALLQNACRVLASGDRRLVLLLQKGRARSAAVLLVGPAAVAIHNLAPLAQVHPGWTLPASGQPGPAAAAALDAAGVERASIRWLAAGLTPDESKSIFPAARLLPRAPAGLIFKLQAAARSLKPKLPLACLIDAPEGQAARVLLIEKL